jgi:hypothetical protein
MAASDTMIPPSEETNRIVRLVKVSSRRVPANQELGSVLLGPVLLGSVQCNSYVLEWVQFGERVARRLVRLTDFPSLRRPFSNSILLP